MIQIIGIMIAFYIGFRALELVGRPENDKRRLISLLGGLVFVVALIGGILLFIVPQPR